MVTIELIETTSKVVDGKNYCHKEYTVGDRFGKYFTHLYRVCEDTATHDGERLFRRISVVPDPDPDNYLPEIYFFDDYLGEKVERFEIQTTSHGLLGLTGFQCFLEAQKIAIEVAKLLTETFIRKEV